MKQPSKWQGLVYAFGNLPHGSYSAFTNAILPLFLIRFTHTPSLIGLLVTLSAFESAIVPLFTGPLSDKISFRLGRRKLLISIGTILVIIFLLLLPKMTNFSLVIAVLLLAGLSNSFTLAPYYAMLTKNAMFSSRGQVLALASIFGLLGQIILTLLAFLYWKNTIPNSAFTLLCIFFLIPTLCLLLFSNDDSKSPNHHNTRNNFFAFFTHPARNLYMLAIILIWFGINSVLPFFTLYITNILHQPQQEAILLYFIIILASGIFAYPFAVLGKKIGEITAFSIGLCALTLAGIFGIFSPVLPVIFLHLIAFLAGFGNAATSVFSFTLLTKLSQEKEMGMAGGVNPCLNAGIAPIAGVISGSVISLLGYPSMFGLLALLTGSSFLLLNTPLIRSTIKKSRYSYDH